MLTDRRKAALRFISQYSQRGYSPSLHEIRAALGFNQVSTVEHHLRVLRREGYLHATPKGCHRSIVLTEEGRSALAEELERAEPEAAPIMERRATKPPKRAREDALAAMRTAKADALKSIGISNAIAAGKRRAA
jgi:SOS-response transcriptional repressor LexA